MRKILVGRAAINIPDERTSLAGNSPVDDQGSEGEHETGQACGVWHKLDPMWSDWILVRQQAGKATHGFSPKKGVEDEAGIGQLVPGEWMHGLCAACVGLPCLAERRILKVVPSTVC